MLHQQERKLAGKPRGWRDYYLATQSDTGVASFWRWLGTFAGKFPLPLFLSHLLEQGLACTILLALGSACCNWPSCLLYCRMPSSGFVQGACRNPQNGAAAGYCLGFSALNVTMLLYRRRCAVV